jgi:hypothetical protein
MSSGKAQFCWRCGFIHLERIQRQFHARRHGRNIPVIPLFLCSAFPPESLSAKQLFYALLGPKFYACQLVASLGRKVISVLGRYFDQPDHARILTITPSILSCKI